MSTTTTLSVGGMTCGHCVSAVRQELGTLPGVHEVTVDLVAGGTSQVQVVSDFPLERDAIADAIDEAGYTLSDQP